MNGEGGKLETIKADKENSFFFCGGEFVIENWGGKRHGFFEEGKKVYGWVDCGQGRKKRYEAICKKNSDSGWILSGKLY